MDNIVYGIDFGGTNVRAARVNPITGEIIDGTLKHAVLDIGSNEELSRIMLSYIPQGSRVGIGAAGDINEEELSFNMSANSPLGKNITFAQELRERGDDVVMGNDMVVAGQAVVRYGEGRGLDNVIVATYSSGNNCAKVSKGKNVTEAEFGHMTYRPGDEYILDEPLRCGCGSMNHLEPYVSGNGAALMAQLYMKQDPLLLTMALNNFNKKNDAGYKMEDIVNQELLDGIVGGIKAKDIYDAYRKKPKHEPQRFIRNTQKRAIAESFCMMNMAFKPVDIIVLMGSVTKDDEELIEPAIRLYNEEAIQPASIDRPPVVITQLPEIGVQGAVAYYVSKRPFAQGDQAHPQGSSRLLVG